MMRIIIQNTKIWYYPILISFIIILLFLAQFITNTRQQQTTDQLLAVVETHYTADLVAEEFRKVLQNMESCARRYIETKNKSYYDEYHDILSWSRGESERPIAYCSRLGEQFNHKKISQTEILRTLHLPESEECRFEEAVRAQNDLIQIEKQVMQCLETGDFVPGPLELSIYGTLDSLIQKAFDDKPYRDNHNKINVNLNTFCTQHRQQMDATTDEMKKSLLSHNHLLFFLPGATLLSLILVSCLIGLIIRRSSIHDEQGQTPVCAYSQGLREKQALYPEREEMKMPAQVMADSAPIGMISQKFHVALEGSFDGGDCNRTVLTMFGCPDKQNLLQNFFSLFSPEIQPEGHASQTLALAKIRAAFNTGYQQFKWLHTDSDGALIPTEITLIKVHEYGEDIMLCYIRDLRHDKGLQDEQNRRDNLMMVQNNVAQILLATTLSTSLEKAIWDAFELLGKAVNVDRVYLWENFRDDKGRLCCVQRYEWSPGVPSQQGEELTVNVVYEQVVPTWEKVLGSGGCINNTVRCMSPEEQNQLVPQGIVSILVAPITFQNKFWGFIGFDDCRQERIWTETEIAVLRNTGHLITSAMTRLLLERSLLDARDAAEKASQAKSQFLATMSHEIRTPLNGVIGLSELILGTELTSKQKEYAELIKLSGESLQFLIDDILDFSKIEAGKIELECDDFDLLHTTESVLSLLSSRARTKSLELCASFHPVMPRVLKGDAGRIRQILMNLVSNAIKFTEKGGVHIDITPETWNQNKLNIYVAVHDTGIGIAKNRIDRLFKMYSQTDISTTRMYGGSGLGLAISMKLVHLMGGEVGVESELGVGSTFWFRLPLDCDKWIQDCIEQKKFICKKQKQNMCAHTHCAICVGIGSAALHDDFNIQQKRILIVIECTLLRHSISKQLCEWGMNVREADSMESFMEQTQKAESEKSPFDLIISDEHFKNGNGLILAEKIEQCQKWHHTGVILLLSINVEVDLKPFQHLKIVAMTKPVGYSALFDTVMTVLYDREWILYQDKLKAETETARSGIIRIRQTEIQENLWAEKAKSCRVLVAEDNRVNQIVITNLLSEAGLHCDLAVNGSEAYQQAINNHYDLILMDCQMPEKNGYEATMMIRKWEQDEGKTRVPIIALTASATKEDIQQCYDSGMNAFYSKPIDVEKLLAEIKKQLGF